MSNQLFKSQLQEYAQKASLSAPVYETIKEGPPHVPNFKASVSVNGVRYDSPEGFRNRKTAEHAAAQVALQELRKGTNGVGLMTNPVYETGLCKNLLQEYAQKLSLPVPSYKCEKEGEGHAATFTATVEIAGICYQGGPANSKKGAEIKAARTALTAIHAQQGFQGFSTNPSVTNHDVLAGTRSSHPEVHAGMKRECAFDQPSGRRKGKKNKRHKALRKKKEVIQGSTEKEKTLEGSSSKATENGQETAPAQNSTAANIDDQQNHQQQETCMDEGDYTKQEQGGSHEIDQTTGNQEQLGPKVVAASVGAGPQNQGGDMVADSQGTNQQVKQETNEERDKLSVEREGQKDQETSQDVVMDPPKNCEQYEQEAKQPPEEPQEKKDCRELETTEDVVADPLGNSENKDAANQAFEDLPEKKDCKEHETQENVNQGGVFPPLET